MSFEMRSITEIVDFNPKRVIKKGTVAPFIDMAALPVSSRNVEEITEKEFKGGGAKFCNGDTLFARITPCLENGKTAKVSGLHRNQNGFGSTEFIVMSAKDREHDEDYVYYLARLPEFRAYAKARMEGTSGRQRVPWQSLAEFEYPMPSKELRKRAGDFFRAIDDKIFLNTKTNKNLEQMAQAIFKSWFVDFDAVKSKMNGEQPEGMDAATASLFPEKLVESELGLIPEGWEVKQLGDYLTIKRGGSPRPIKEFIVPDGYPWTKIADATANDNPYIFKTKEFIREEGLKKTVYLKKGTLILSNSATPGLPRFLDLDACIHDGWLHFPEKKHFTDSYLYQLFLHIRKHLVSQGNGSVFTNLKTDILRNQVVLVPPKELVDIYEIHAGKILETVKAKSIENNQLSQLRDTLLPKLLSGEIELGTNEEL
ncbi:restriction endonuclease subunit S [Photobacterium angustum]|uniref:Restriction endonuclease subunit S n=1 Tax=Photobacterium angustum TaxID=661 RepID=A0A855S9Y9_PHOAN|nr:restriction endonuclease subunit S [Photobacterium angustum]KJF81520.1 hypothetical protein UB36_12395 [Photobacterium damselae subsp. damselae]KJG41069.1 hypothetical protein UA35_11535 [Photobacterium angustum]KJG45105.1 hypothetical protein UA31_12400 [Photobacterium angustum]KJG48680.1 hypothetical protein UA30_12815 [Photobacterium angustum]KJG52690.1 hypothetical protein UA34_12920 [Photobacterium angustum]